MEKILVCRNCRMGHGFWVMTEEPCRDSGGFHKWAVHLHKNEEPEGKNVVIGGQSAYQIGGFITWD